MQTFTSNYEINQEVSFTPMARHQNKFGIEPGILSGKIVAVRFTEAKVFYDIYNSYWGKIFDKVDSVNVDGI